VHRFQIDDPNADGVVNVYYRSRRNVAEYLDIVQTAGRLNGISFGSKRDPCESIFKKVMCMFMASSDSKNVGVTISLNMPGQSNNSEKPVLNGHTNGVKTLHVRTDASFFKEINPVTLEARESASQEAFHPHLIGEFSAAHGKSDPNTGDTYNFNLKLGYIGTYRVFCTSVSTGKTTILASFTGTSAYIHSFFLTENYVLLCVWNSHITWGGLSIMYYKNVVNAIGPFDPTSKATWYVIDRKHGKGLVATYESEPFFCFHTVNAWEEPNPADPKKTDIIAELSKYNNTDVVTRYDYDNINSAVAHPDFAGRKRLSCLPMQTQFRLASIESAADSKTPLPVERLFQVDKMISMELPTINPRYLTRRHRYSYGCPDRLKSSFMDGIVKFDNITQQSIFWEVEGHTPGEPIFVADPDGTAEDDGVLLTVVLDGRAEKSYLLVLRAQDLNEMGRAEMDGPMSFGFHGAYKNSERKYTGDM
jgi:torulene dioxygenase